jgi:fluoride exporter
VQRALLISLGGAIGTLARYLTALAAARVLGIDFPWGTLIVNLVGSFLIGLVQALALDALVLSQDARLFLAAGVMGGLTTYSAFSYESVKLAEIGAWPQAILYVAVTTIACLALCYLGMGAGRVLAGPGR